MADGIIIGPGRCWLLRAGNECINMSAGSCVITETATGFQLKQAALKPDQSSASVDISFLGARARLLFQLLSSLLESIQA